MNKPDRIDQQYDNKVRIVLIAGGSFQGKSIIALNTANYFNFSCVISTDLIRNLLIKLSPDDRLISTSTYRLDKHNLNLLINRVSDILKNIVPIYIKRGEHLIIEGTHLSTDIIKWANDNGFCCIFIDNLNPLTERVILKNITRTQLRKGNNYDYGYINRSNVFESSYIKHDKEISQIHEKLKKSCTDNRFNIIKFYNIDTAKKDVIKFISKFYSINNNIQKKC